MKQFFFLSFLLALSACRQAAPVPETGKAVMCSGHDDAVAQFASFADNAEFRGMHPDPLPVEVTKKGKMVDFPVAVKPTNTSCFFTNGGASTTTSKTKRPCGARNWASMYWPSIYMTGK